MSDFIVNGNRFTWSLSMKSPCCSQSTPASMQSTIAWPLRACAVTRLPSRWASSTIRALFKGGAALDLTPQAPATRWPWEKSLEISHGELRYDAVHAKRAAE